MPVRVHLWFFLTALVLAGTSDVLSIVQWTAVVFASVLIHELGHAAAMRSFGLTPAIDLIAMGGLTSAAQPTPLAWWKSLLISLAGPFTGLAFGLAVSLASQLMPGVREQPRLHQLVDQLLWVNVGWGVLNLLPIYPLDGGQALEAGLRPLLPRTGFVVVRVTTVLVGGAGAVFGFTSGWYWAGLIGGYYAALSARDLYGFVSGKAEASHPMVKAAGAVLRGDLGRGEMLANAHRLERPDDPAAAMLLGCIALERREPATALRHALTVSTKQRKHGEMLQKLAELRQLQPDGDWPDQFLVAWKHCGRPDLRNNFALSGAALELEPPTAEQFSALPAETKILVELSLLSPNRVPALPDSSVTLTPQVALALKVAHPAAPLQVPLDDDNAWPRLALLLVESSAPAVPFSKAELEALEQAAALPRFESGFFALYLQARDAFSEAQLTFPRHRAFQAACSTLPLKWLVLRDRLRLNWFHGEEGVRERCERLMFRIARLHATDTCAINRMVGLAIELEVSQWGTPKSTLVPQRRAELTKWLEGQEQRANWPIPSLRDEFLDRYARNEMAWLIEAARE